MMQAQTRLLLPKVRSRRREAVNSRANDAIPEKKTAMSKPFRIDIYARKWYAADYTLPCRDEGVYLKEASSAIVCRAYNHPY